MGDAAILLHNPRIFVVIRLGLCKNFVKVRYINRLTVFHGIDVGKHWRTNASVSSKRNRLIYILYIVSYARGFSVIIFSNTNREWVFHENIF